MADVRKQNSDTVARIIVTAGDKYVYVAYQQINGWDDFDPGANRPLKVRINMNHGSSTAWLSTKTFDAAARAGHPAVAANGSWAYIAYTDALTGDIVVARNLGSNSEDAGWVAANVGTTTNEAPNDNGRDGYPVIAATGGTVLVAWISGDGTTISAKVSTDHGDTWPDDERRSRPRRCGTCPPPAAPAVSALLGAGQRDQG